ncbi:MAG TPA: Nramp family divalent metal transporter [Bacteroidia bacterium]|jgi:manganese transport protein|nr:Nramp family divalent metal transporter [Bacteroidia bacterium]
MSIKEEKEKAWRKESASVSLPEVFSSIRVPGKGGFWKKLLAFSGPGLMVAVGYMDPGNWATDIEGGSKFGYTLLSVILISNLFAILLQYLALKLGVATEKDLAQACRSHYSPRVSFMLWIFCEIAIAACDLAEVIGSAIALNLLFKIPLTWGVVITGFDVLLILFFQYKGFRFIESVVGSLIVIIVLAFVFEMIVSHPQLFPMLSGLLPKPEIVTNLSELYIAIGILGATVMPHNLYLHSSIVQTRDYPRTTVGKKMAIKFAAIDSTVALMAAFFINAAILIVAAASFHSSGHNDVSTIMDAHKLLTPLLGTTLASTLFAVALLASGQNSTLTGTLAGQIVMEGFLDIKLKPWLRRLITRGIAIVPAFIVTFILGERGTANLLVLSQVILSMQLSFAVIPLIMFTNSKQKMGLFANRKSMKIVAWAVAIIILGLNLYLLYDTIFL